MWHAACGVWRVAATEQIEKFEMFRGVMRCLIMTCACAALVVLLVALDSFRKVRGQQRSSLHRYMACIAALVTIAAFPAL
jgi:hypothetical protein